MSGINTWFCTFVLDTLSTLPDYSDLRSHSAVAAYATPPKVKSWLRISLEEPKKKKRKKKRKHIKLDQQNKRKAKATQ